MHRNKTNGESAVPNFRVIQAGWWARQDLNLGPTDYESAALTAELQAQRVTNILH